MGEGFVEAGVCTRLTMNHPELRSGGQVRTPASPRYFTRMVFSICSNVGRIVPKSLSGEIKTR
jgi:hypothetical protein